MNVHIAIVQAMDEMGIKQPPQVVEFCNLVEEKLQADNKPSMQVCPQCSMGIIGFIEYRCVNGQCDYRGRGKPAHIG